MYSTTPKGVLSLMIFNKGNNMQTNQKMCKNGCNAPAYKRRSICRECVNAEYRKRWNANKESWSKYRAKPKISAECKLCGKSFQTARKEQKFCCPRHRDLWHKQNRDIGYISRVKALIRIHDRGKKRVNGEKYTKKEVDYIIKHHGTKSSVEIAKVLDRPVTGVRWKIRKLKEKFIIFDESILAS